jgi:outer membrane receptor protein involved in Fe transport
MGRASLDIAFPTPPHEGQPEGMLDPHDVSTSFKGAVAVFDFAQWVAATASLAPTIRATVGLRLDEFARNDDTEVQPRAELSAKLSRLLKVRIAAGAYRRPPENMDEYLHSELKGERATQVITGLEVTPDETTRVQTSLFYTDRSHLITNDASGALGNFGRGTTYGAELLATYRRGPWFLWLSGSLSRSTRVDYPGAPERLFSYDQPVSVNAAASWKKGKWQLGARFELYSGLPSTPVVGSVFDSDRNIYIPIFGAINSERAPPHHQLDLRVDRSWKWGPVLMTWFLDVQNVYMNTSVAGYAYSYDYSQSIAFKSLPIIPSIGLRGVL